MSSNNSDGDRWEWIGSDSSSEDHAITESSAEAKSLKKKLAMLRSRRFPCLPELKRPLELSDFQVFRSPELSKLPTSHPSRGEPPIDWRAIQLHFVNLLKVSDPWIASRQDLGPILTDPESEERASEDQIFLWLLLNSHASLYPHLLGLRMVRNPVPFILDGAVLRDIGASMPAVPLLLSFRYGATKLGVSKLLNETLQTDFEVNDDDDCDNSGYMQIQFPMDYMSTGRRFAVADAHGPMDAYYETFRALLPHVQAVLIHVEAAKVNDPGLVSIVDGLCNGDPAKTPVVVLSRDDPTVKKKCKECTSSHFPPEVLVMSLPDFRKGERLKDGASDLRTTLMQSEHLGATLTSDRAAVFSRASLEALAGDRSYPEVDAVMRAIAADPDGIGKLAKAHASICELSKKISMSSVQDDRQTLLRCSEARRQKVQELRELCEGEHTAIYRFIQCVGHADAAVQMQELHRRCAPVESKEVDKKEVDTVDILIKELYLLMEQGALRGAMADQGPYALANYIWAGNPFEILDGDNFHLHVGSLKKTFTILDQWLKTEKLPLHVESTLGPQSSGKSTLKNSMYGCRFDVSEGRTTRGITGQLVRTEADAVLILDTEGLQSAEKGDPHFDRVMTLFMLAASHHIDMNIKGNLNDPLKRLFEICVRACMNLEIAKLESPKIHWILNQVADKNKKNHQDTFRLIKEELEQVFEHDGSGTIEQIQLDEDNITIVPSKFNERVALLGEAAGGKTWTRMGISMEYSQGCQKMRRESALQRADKKPLQPGADGQEAALTLQAWLAMCADLWRTILSYPDLTYYKDVKQVRLDRELRSWIDSKLQQRFQSEDGLKEEQVKMEEWRACPVIEDAKSLLNNYFTDLSQELQEMFKTRCRELGCDDAQLSDRLERILESKLTTRHSSWQTQLQRHFKEAEVKSACMFGHAKMRQRIRELLRQQDVNGVDMTGPEIEQEFEEMFEKVIVGMQTPFKKENFEHDLLKRMHAASASPYRLSFKDLHDIAIHRTATAVGPSWIARDKGAPALPWRTPTLGTTWMRFFSEDFLDAVTSTDQHLSADQGPVVVGEHRPMLRAMNTFATTVVAVLNPYGISQQQSVTMVPPAARRSRSAGHRRRPLAMEVAALVLHLRDPRQSLLSDREICAGVMKVIKWQLALQELDNRVSALLAGPSRRPDINLVQLVEQAAANVTDEVSKALKAVGCKFARDGMGEFVSRALIKSWHLVKDDHYRSYMQPIEEFKMEKPRQKEYWVASIRQDKDSDKIVAKKLAREVGEVVLSDLTREGERLLRQILSRNSLKLGREALQEACDSCLGTDDTAAQLENILNPAEAIERQFDHAFPEAKREAKAAFETDCVTESELRLRQVASHAEALCRLPGMEQENTMSEQAFELVGSHSGGPAVTRAVKRWAAGQCLRSAFVDAEPGNSWETPDLWGVGPLKVRVRDGKPQQLLGPLSEEPLKVAVQEAWQDVDGDTSGMGCMHVVLQEMATAFPEICLDVKEKLASKFEAQVEALRSELRSNVVVCRALCPCCARICDNAELGDKHIHRCSSGHQCRGFRGVYLQDGKRTASTRICSQVNDDDKYIDEQGREWTWREFKKAHEDDWDFSDRFDERSKEFQARMLLAWRKVGQQICTRFGIHWTLLGEEQTLSSSPTHFILVLDSSGSMNSGGWVALHGGVSEMFQVRKAVDGSAADRFSALAFSHETKRLFLYQDVDQALTTWRQSSSKPITGQTDFTLALKGAVSILKDCAHQRHHRITLVFMSDGAGRMEGIDEVIQNLKETVADRPFSAFTIAYGSPGSFGRLSEVADKLGGTYVSAVTDMDLRRVFVEVAQRNEGGAAPVGS